MSEASVSQSVHQRLLNIRDKTGESFQHILMRYGLERFLYRLVASGHSDQFVLKGAVLFSLWYQIPGRPTRDLDLLGYGDIDHVRLHRLFAEICTVEVEDDGLRFDADSIRTEDIRNDQEYHGIRVRLMGFLGRARLAIQIDVGFGDSLRPEPSIVEYPVLLDYPAPRLRVYHPAVVVAEKFNAMVVLGTLNSRLKDFYDIHVILHNMDIEPDIIKDAIVHTFARRKIPLPLEMPVAFTSAFIEDGNKQKQWEAFLKRSELNDFRLSFKQVVDDIREKLWPLIQ